MVVNRALLSSTALLCLLSATGCDGGRSVAVIEREFDLGEAEHLVLDQRSGDLSVVGQDDRDNVEIVAELRSNRLSEDRDEAAVKSLRLGVNSIDDSAGRILAGLDNPPRGYYVDVTIFVPSSMTMDIEDSSGDARVENIAGLSFRDDSGDLEIEGIGGNVFIADKSGDIDIRGVAGDVELDDRSGDIEIDDVDGDVDLDDRSGDIEVDDVSGTVTVSDRSGDITIDNAGDVDIVSDGSGDVTIR